MAESMRDRLLRRLRGADRAGEIALSVLLFCHPMARPQGFAYWPFVALAVLVLLGTGIALSNTVAVIQGLTGRSPAFRRTPATPC